MLSKINNLEKENKELKNALLSLHKIFECEDTDKLITNYNRAKAIVNKSFGRLSTIFENITEDMEC